MRRLQLLQKTVFLRNGFCIQKRIEMNFLLTGLLMLAFVQKGISIECYFLTCELPPAPCNLSILTPRCRDGNKCYKNQIKETETVSRGCTTWEKSGDGCSKE
uniref:Uncharacterized protein n=1 Tax=Strigamia maritima TaxID=126957 RepID=T1JEM2_STRMM